VVSVKPLLHWSRSLCSKHTTGKWHHLTRVSSASYNDAHCGVPFHIDVWWSTCSGSTPSDSAVAWLQKCICSEGTHSTNDNKNGIYRVDYSRIVVVSVVLQLVTQWTLVDGVHRQFEAFREGFESLFPLSTLRLFYPNEVTVCLCAVVIKPHGAVVVDEFCSIF